MRNNLITTNNTIETIASMEVAIMIGKGHKELLRDIRRLIQRNPELQNEFILSSYISKQNKKLPCMKISKKGYEILKQKYKYNIRSARFEYKMLNEIIDFLTILKQDFIMQYKVLNYRIDMYLPQYNIAIEYDEREHLYKKEKDAKRELEIKQILKCTFLRINEETTVGEAIAKLLLMMKNQQNQTQ